MAQMDLQWAGSIRLSGMSELDADAVQLPLEAAARKELCDYGGVV